MIKKELNREEFISYLKTQGPLTKIYFGADSERKLIDGKWKVDYFLAIIVHEDQKHGGKVFGEIHREDDYDTKKHQPRNRLMNEVYKISELFLSVQDIVSDFEIELHLDINPKIIHGSSCVLSEAIGYVKGISGLDAKVKPDAWAASTGADRLAELV